MRTAEHCAYCVLPNYQDTALTLLRRLNLAVIYCDAGDEDGHTRLAYSRRRGQQYVDSLAHTISSL